MEITISEVSRNRFELRTSLGHLAVFTDADAAEIYARGMRMGYQAAADKIGGCVGWKRA